MKEPVHLTRSMLNEKMYEYRKDFFKQLYVALIGRDGIKALTPENTELIINFLNKVAPLTIEIKDIEI